MTGPRVITGSTSSYERDVAELPRMTDDDGHRWPVTGYWCSECSLPLHPVHVAYGTHPGCDRDQL